jgi:hypothetical protein
LHLDPGVADHLAQPVAIVGHELAESVGRALAPDLANIPMLPLETPGNFTIRLTGIISHWFL